MNKTQTVIIENIREELLKKDELIANLVKEIENSNKSRSSIIDSLAINSSNSLVNNNDDRYKLLFDNNPMPIAIFDAETLHFLNINEAFCQKYGYSYEEFLKMTILDIRPKEEFDLVKNSVKLNDTGVVNVGVFTHKKKK